MLAKLILRIIPVEGEFERKDTILQICKKAIEEWKGDKLTKGYNISVIGHKNDIKGKELYLEEKNHFDLCPYCSSTDIESDGISWECLFCGEKWED